MEEKHMTKMLNEAAQEMLQQPIQNKPKFTDDELVSLFSQKEKKLKKKKGSLDDSSI